MGFIGVHLCTNPIVLIFQLCTVLYLTPLINDYPGLCPGGGQDITVPVSINASLSI